MSRFFKATVTMFNSGTALRGQNVLWFEDPSETKTESQLFTAIDTEWYGLGTTSNRYRELTAQLSKSESVTIQRISPGPPTGGQPFTMSSAGGVQATLILYPTVGFVFQLFDGGAGAAHRGRVYHYGTPSNLTSNFIPNTVAATKFALVRDAWLNAFGPLPTTGFHLCIFHRKLTGDARWTRVTDIRLGAFLHHQRRRNFATGF